jgi:hypothetical protein
VKKLTLGSLLLLSLGFIASLCFMAQAGPEPMGGKDKEMITPAPPPPPVEFFRTNEWDLSIWGTFAFSANQGRNNVPNDDPFTPDLDPEIVVGTLGSTTHPEPQGLNPNERVNLGPVSRNTFLGADNAWGGGVDVKYFFSKYFGVGVEGFVVNAETQLAGGGLATFTARYPMGRFAPYSWIGAGAVAGGGEIDRFFYETHTYSGGFVTDENEFFRDEKVNNNQVFFDGQLGAGFEFRITPHIGLMTDFAWNFIMSHDNRSRSEIITSPGGTNYDSFIPVTFPNNTAIGYVPGGAADKDFGMVRFGLTISY